MPDWCGVREAADVGMFAQSLMLALTAHGLASCPQSSLSHYAAVVKRELNIPDDMRLLFGLSFGYEDPDHPSNLVRRSEERRVGQGCVSPCSSRWSLLHKKETQNILHKE